MDTSKYLFDGERNYKTGKIDPADKPGGKDKAWGAARLAQNRQKISALQNALYAEARQSLLVVIQAMDAAGKDGTIQHVFTGVNPQGIAVTSFKQPSGEELAHDYLWRVHKAAPRRGMIGVFNRSHYEDVLISRVLNLPAAQNLTKREKKDTWNRRYRQIRDFERHLYENGTTVLKFYLHLSRDEQNRRFLARLDEADKNWKFSKADLKTSEHWKQYMGAFEQAINETAAPHAPWYVVPADHKWYTRLVVSQVVLDALEKMAPAYPEIGKDQKAEIEECRALLERELGGR